MISININKNFLAIIFSFLIVSFLFFAVYLIIKDIERLSFDFISEKNKIANLEKEKESFKKTEDIYKAQEENLAKTDRVFVNQEVPITFINFLEEQANKENLTLEIFSITKNKTKEDPWPNLVLKLSLKGSFYNFLKFLEKIENSLYLIEPIELEVKKTSVDSSENKESGLRDQTINNLLIKVYSKE